MKITVTETDIKLGTKTPLSNTQCPIARAMRRALRLRDIRVGISWAKTKQGYILLPVEAMTAINGMIDANVTGRSGMKPFNFTLSQKQINILKGNR